MAKKPAVHVVPHGDGWATRREGSTRVSKTYDRQSDAVADGRAAAKRDQTELLVHNRKGQMRDRSTYGKDPYPPEG